jgi:hypothetical protein
MTNPLIIMEPIKDLYNYFSTLLIQATELPISSNKI